MYFRLWLSFLRCRFRSCIHKQTASAVGKNAQDSGFVNILFLADDGYSGTNFERPSWKKIVELIENGEVETLIVKDMSCQLLSR